MANKFSFYYSVGSLVIAMFGTPTTGLGPLGLAATVVYENASDGTYVGAITGRTQGSTLSLTDNAGGRFTLDAATGVVRVANGSLLDFEDDNLHQIIVTETLAGQPNSPRVSTLNIALTNVETPTWSGQPVITGSNSLGSQLTGSDGVFNTGTVISREWVRSNTVIATGNVYVITSQDIGFTLTYRVTVQNSAGEINTATSPGFGPVQSGGQSTSLNALTMTPSAVPEKTTGSVVGQVAGRTTGSTLTIFSDSTGGAFAISNSTGIITVANGALLDYETTTGGAGSPQIVIRETLGGATNSPRNTPFTVPVSDVASPSWAQNPSITGTPSLGFQLTGNNGTISNGSVTAQEWLRGGSVIATGPTYTTVQADVGSALTYRVTATNIAGETNQASTVSGVISAGSVISSVQVRNDITYIAEDNDTGIVSGVTPILIPTNGWVLQVNFSTSVDSIDPTKLVVNIERPGYESNGQLTQRKWTDECRGTARLRKPHPRPTEFISSGANSFLVTLDDQIYGSDFIVSVDFLAGFYVKDSVASGAYNLGSGFTRSDNKVYPKPTIDCVEQPYTIRVPSANGTFNAEFFGSHPCARGGKPFARVEAYGWNIAQTQNGPVGAATDMSLLTKTPDLNNPSKMRASGYIVPINTTGLNDGACEIRWVAYPQVGDVIHDSGGLYGSADGTAFPAQNGATGIPFSKDVANKYSPIYAYVNFDGSGITSATDDSGILLTATDPAATGQNIDSVATGGQGKSYASISAACAAAATWNNKTANRPGSNNHATYSGLHIILRNVSTSVLGQNPGVYSGRGLVGTSDGPLAVVVMTANGLPTDQVRFSSYHENGTLATSSVAGTASRWFPKKVEMRGITFDNTFTPGADNTFAHVFYNVNSGVATEAALVSFMCTKDCRIRAKSGHTSSWTSFYRVGYRYDLRMDQIGGSTAVPGNFIEMIRSIGSRYESTDSVYGRMLNAVWTLGATRLELEGGGVATPRMNVFNVANIRTDFLRSGSGSSLQAMSAATRLAMLNILVVKHGTGNSDSILLLQGDSGRGSIDNGSMFHFSADGGLDDGGRARTNIDYNDDRLGSALPRNLDLKYNAFYSYNTKDDTHVHPSANLNAVGVVANSTSYSPGEYVTDGNVTTAARKYYRARAFTTTSGTALNDLGNTAVWELLGDNIYDGAITTNGRRVNNWRGQYNVARQYNVMTISGNSSAPGVGGSWLGEVSGRGTLHGQNLNNYYEVPKGGPSSTVYTDYGNQTPKAGVSPLLNKVPSGRGVTKYDIYGNLRNQTGSGAAGAIEAGNAFTHS